MRIDSFLKAALICALTTSAGYAHPGPGIAIDAKDQVYFVDFTRDRILKIDTGGKLTVFADGAKAGLFTVPHHLFIDASGNLFTASDRNGQVVRIAPDGQMTQLYPPTNWYGVNFLGSGGDPFAIDSSGNIFGLNRRQAQFLQIIRVAPKGRMDALAGGAIGLQDGVGAAARFGEPIAMTFACSKDGDLFVSDATAIRRVKPDGTVATFAGSPESGQRDGQGAAARFTNLAGISFDPNGNLWAAEPGVAKIRKISPDGTVTTLPFSDAPPASDSVRSARPKPAHFSPLRPVGVAVGQSGRVYVLDYPLADDPRVSRIEPDGNVHVLATVGIDPITP